jgi:acyl carrier protein
MVSAQHIEQTVITALNRAFGRDLSAQLDASLEDHGLDSLGTIRIQLDIESALACGELALDDASFLSPRTLIAAVGTAVLPPR